MVQNNENWLQDYDYSRTLAQEILQLIQERNVKFPEGGPEASRLSAVARKKIGTLGMELDKLLQTVDSPNNRLSDQEKNRRRDLVYDLKGRREQMQLALKRPNGQAERESLLSGGTSAAPPLPVETEQTALLDNQGLLLMQRRAMQEQDDQLSLMERNVSNTKHIAIAINEELDLQTRLLDDLTEDVDVTQSRLRAATHRVSQMLRQHSASRAGYCVFLAIVGFVATLVLVFKLYRLFHA
uniref:t-SNARE coiled-coil homology domain-containing protein n=1 Tax=Polytomella parva TaxID=51329 RepID=A0A7S0YDD8_9CHLO|mmetsp:Transcript_19542/g.35232  ORF Transcript_19542/g.35232 Transcript_19542/m.35232 type:complete len:240 (+) Transcript_19542:104-823(+)|eukprot:CAMPEP_0175064692 /NCGR_PEP_ID=MMETSP0052_2-20121109/15483_1 /TAXON_ID=51329 ORGANISM="Polytomella parva, Strain SAG 63-3" /NCGR_SAMPLE_ID=MMETSP0052_2 /ASSEMBLY_ACC=CAM_ASM_000194 /LENGTH=239 /DNA_ID=CAMNT_0016331089 /DNA_START=72 /DNA_END=791 /DNA_ORIENTATION=+